MHTLSSDWYYKENIAIGLFLFTFNNTKILVVIKGMFRNLKKGGKKAKGENFVYIPI